MQRPFETGDLLEVVGVTGYVQQLNVRSTILMTLDGNLVQIPNATIYKSNLRNFTTNSNRREDFVVGIGYDDSINDAQEIARKVLVDHPAILNDPEPLVLADSPGQATINLRVYFWLKGREHSWLKVRSSVIRLVKLAFQEHGISMPDEAREVVFPQGVPVTMLDGKPVEERNPRPRKKLAAGSPDGKLDAISTKAEAGFSSEEVVIEKQARLAQPLKHGENPESKTINSMGVACFSAPPGSGAATQAVRENGRIRMTINSKDFRVQPGEKVRLAKWPTIVKPICKSKDQYQELLGEHVEKLSSLQHLHYASNRYALLLIFQGMDAGGKDGAIRHVMSGVNPQGCEVFSFKEPSSNELEHDFLWRTTCVLPERGRIGIFNRSYYEEVLVVRVHPGISRGQGLPQELRDEKTIWEERYRSIVDLENHLHRNGTRIVKIFLHLSKDEQRKRFLERIDEPDKNWKLSIADIHERKYWKSYMKAYEECLHATSTHHAHWYIVPADDKENARLIVSQIVLDALDDLKMAYPTTTAKRQRELKSLRKLLTK